MNFSHSARASAEGSSHSWLDTTGIPAWRMTLSSALVLPPAMNTPGRCATTSSVSITEAGANSRTRPLVVRRRISSPIRNRVVEIPVSTSSRPRSTSSGRCVVEAENSDETGTTATWAPASAPTSAGRGAPHCSNT